MWEDRYANSDGYFFGTEPARFLLDNPGWLRPGLSGLCVADGEGRNSVHMAQLGLNMTALDLSETAVARARKLAADRDVDVNFTQSLWDDRDWNTPTYDLVAAIFIQFAGPSERGKQFAHIKAVVKPGGILMLHGYTREQLALGTGGPPFIDNMYTSEILSKYFGNWHIERLAAYERDVQEGRGHSGKSALIARKPG